MSEPAALHWRVGWFAATEGARLELKLVAALGAALGTVATLAWLPPLAGGALLVAFTLSLQSLVFPQEFRVSAEGVRVRSWIATRRYAWSRFQRAVPSPRGVELRSPLRGGLLLVLPPEPALVLAFAEQAIAGVSRDPRRAASDGRGAD